MNQDEDKVTTQQDDINESDSQNEQNTEEQFSQRQAENKSTSSEEYQRENNHDDEVEKSWHNKNAIKRGIAMLGYGFVAGFVRLGITLIAIFQFFSLLFSEKPNQPLVEFGQNLNTYQYQINQFLTVNSEMYPFPFADWPDSAPKG